MFQRIDRSEVTPEQNKTSRLCDQCNNIDFFEGLFKITQSVSELESRSALCDLCALMHDCAVTGLRMNESTVTFHRVSSYLAFERHSPPVLSFCRFPESDFQAPIIPLGFPKVPDTRSAAEFEVMRQWLFACDNTHTCNPALEGVLPTRVVDTGAASDTRVLKLYCSQPGERGRYVALSHRWGNPHLQRPFFTSRSLFSSFQKSISFDELPTTFQHAVEVTRRLGIRFLWIDSICIIQDDADDWEAESKLMETVFSDAYFTIAASCAKDASDGFLKPKLPRKTVRMGMNDADTYYICEAVDDFKTDVEDCDLNRRGWVLQERALSHRSIHFAQTQMYWECGDGVHCETLRKMRNNKSSFLGDPEFPRQGEKLYKGGKIVLYEEVYKRYSTLDFTRVTDRAVAIKGLESRLIRTFQTLGYFGVFDQYLERSLLWQRAKQDMMRVIEYPTARRVPSWSWMAYDGAITYVEPPFGKVEWLKQIESPFRSNSFSTATSAHSFGILANNTTISAKARELKLDPSKKPTVVFDESDWTGPDIRCVVLGRDRELTSTNTRQYYVLLIKSVSTYNSTSERGLYRRVGAGIVTERYINMDLKPREVSIE